MLGSDCFSSCSLHTFYFYLIRRHAELDCTSDVFRWCKLFIFSISYPDLCAIFDNSNTKRPTKEHATSKERRHELVMMTFARV